MRLLTGMEGEEAEHRMNEAAKVAKNATCLRVLCGSVIVQLGKVIGTGYNSPPGDICPVECLKKHRPAGFKSDESCCVHAEQRAIRDADRTHPDAVEGSTLYFTRIEQSGCILHAGKPFCTICSKAARDSKIANFVLRHPHGIVTYDTDEYNRLSFAYNGEI